MRQSTRASQKLDQRWLANRGARIPKFAAPPRSRRTKVDSLDSPEIKTLPVKSNMILPVNWVRHERQVVLRTGTPHAAARSRGAGGRREQGIRKKITEMKMRLKDPGGAKPISGPARRLIEYMAVVRGLRGPRASGICITMYAGPVSELGVEI